MICLGNFCYQSTNRFTGARILSRDNDGGIIGMFSTENCEIRIYFTVSKIEVSTNIRASPTFKRTSLEIFCFISPCYNQHIALWIAQYDGFLPAEICWRPNHTTRIECAYPPRNWRRKAFIHNHCYTVQAKSLASTYDELTTRFSLVPLWAVRQKKPNTVQHPTENTPTIDTAIGRV